MKFSNEILNAALDLSMEFGENWLKPINERLQKLFPNLDQGELENCNSICKQVNEIANKYILENPVQTNDGYEFISFNDFQNFITKKYEWISHGNAEKLYSQSCYYALK